MTEELIIEQRDGRPYLVTAPLPEAIQISRGLWDETPELYPPEDFEAGLAPPAIWREKVGHADPDIDNDGYVFHVEASNAYVAYRVTSVPEEGNIIGVLASWGER